MDQRFKIDLSNASHSLIVFTAIVIISMLVVVIDLEQRNNKILERVLTCQDQVDFAREIDKNVNEVRAYVGMNPEKVKSICDQQ